MKKSKWCLETREERKKRIRKYNYEMKWKWINIIYDFNFINSFEWIIYEFVSRERSRRQVEEWRSNLTDSDNLIMKKRWEKIYEFNINQFILRYKKLYIEEDDYYSDYSDSKWYGDSDEECFSYPSSRNSYFDDDNWRQREHDTEESFRLAGD